MQWYHLSIKNLRGVPGEVAHLGSHWKCNTGGDFVPCVFAWVPKHCVTGIIQGCLRHSCLGISNIGHLQFVLQSALPALWPSCFLRWVGGGSSQTLSPLSAAAGPFLWLLPCSVLSRLTPSEHFTWSALAPPGPESTSLPAFPGLWVPTAAQRCNRPSASFTVWMEHRSVSSWPPLTTCSSPQLRERGLPQEHALHPHTCFSHTAAPRGVPLWRCILGWKSRLVAGVWCAALRP